VIVGDTNGRYFEPAPGRNWFVGASIGVRLWPLECDVHSRCSRWRSPSCSVKRGRSPVGLRPRRWRPLPYSLGL